MAWCPVTPSIDPKDTNWPYQHRSPFVLGMVKFRQESGRTSRITGYFGANEQNKQQATVTINIMSRVPCLPLIKVEIWIYGNAIYWLTKKIVMHAFKADWPFLLAIELIVRNMHYMQKATNRCRCCQHTLYCINQFLFIFYFWVCCITCTFFTFYLLQVFNKFPSGCHSGHAADLCGCESGKLCSGMETVGLLTLWRIWYIIFLHLWIARLCVHIFFFFLLELSYQFSSEIKVKLDPIFWKNTYSVPIIWTRLYPF